VLQQSTPQRWAYGARAAHKRRVLPAAARESQIASQIAPLPGEIVVTKTTDSALTGTALRLMLTNLGITQVLCCGIFTEQCVSSTVRSLADESFSVIVIEDGCAAGTDALHRNELEVINRIHCYVMSSEELFGYLP
jgi:nicotinamidase-related amidase